MKEVVLLFLIAMIMSGCAVARVKTSLADSGSPATCEAIYVSALKGVSELEMKACGAMGGAGKSDVQLSDALVGLLVRGLAGGR